MITHLYIIPILAVTVFLLIRAEFADHRKYIYFLKPMATLFVLGTVTSAFFQPDYNGMYTRFVLIALLFSLGGDLALMFPKNRKAFSLGLGLFLTAHAVYTVAFMRVGQFSVWTLIPVAIMFILGISFYQLIHVKLGSMKGPVIAYIVIISIMVVSATMVWESSVMGKSQALMIMGGASLFYISDIILAANRFWKAWQYNRISLAFYYSGQLLIALAAGYSK